MNPVNTKDNYCFMNALTIAPTHRELEKTQAAYHESFSIIFLSTTGTI